MSHWDFFAFFKVKKRVLASREKMSFRDIQGFKGTVSMKHQGRIVLFRFLHASLAEGKTRPALLLSEAFLKHIDARHQFLKPWAFHSSRIHQLLIHPFTPSHIHPQNSAKSLVPCPVREDIINIVVR